MPERDRADSDTEGSSSAMNGSVHFESGGADTDASVNQVADMEDEKSDYKSEEKVGEDAEKDDFLDASEELNTDNRDSAVTSESEAALDEQSIFPDNHSGQVVNGEPDDDLMEEIRRLQGLLEKTVVEKEFAEREYEEERERFAREISELCHQIKDLTYRGQVLENGDLSANHHGVAESGSGKEKLEVSVTLLRDTIMECSKLIGGALEERSQMETSIRDLNATLYTKDKQIEDLNSKITELSVAQDVQTENHRRLEFVTRRMLDSLAFVAVQEELVDDSVGEIMNLVERRTVALIEKYSHIYYQIDQLRQFLPEAGSELLPDELGNVVAGACDQLLEAQRKEAYLVEKLKMVEVENEKLLEKLNKDKAALEESNMELGRVRVELEQEKTRLANVKEKLSMAVTKGKSLVQQRDSLKQSLAEKSSELERCLNNLHEKSNALEAAEAAMEELRQNESLVALLQENLSQRNAILVKFEEVLSEASLPKEIQLLDITEKYRWLVDERNSLRDISMEYQKCKDALSLVELPESVSSSDSESIVVWLKESFYQAKNEVEVLQSYIAKTKERAHNEIDRLSASLSAMLQEKDYLESELADLKLRYEETLEKEGQVSAEKVEMALLLVQKSGLAAGDRGCDYKGISLSDFDMLVDQCFEKMRENTTPPDCSPIDLESFERIKSLLYVRQLDLMLCEEVLEEEVLTKSEEVDNMSNELKVLSEELSAVKEERRSLQKDLERSEDKSAILREKLSLAVKKGKGLVQDRENLKNLLDEKNREIEKLKCDLQQQESAVTDCKEEITRMSELVKRIPDLEGDLTLLKDEKGKLEQFLLESNNMLQRMIESVENIELPPEFVAEEPAEKMKWLVASFIECRTSKDSIEQELSRAREETSNLTARFTETVAAVEKMQRLEQDFEKVKEEGSTLGDQLKEAQATIKTLEDELSAAQNSITQLAEEKREMEIGKIQVLEQDFEKVKHEAISLGDQLREARETIKTLEDELSAAQNSISQLAEERREIEIGKMQVLEQDFELVKEEASTLGSQLREARATIKTLEDELSAAQNSISQLAEERREVEIGKMQVPEQDFEKVKEEASILGNQLREARATIKTLEDELSAAQNSISQLADERREIENRKMNAEQNLQEALRDASSYASSFAEACAIRKSLEEALSQAENNISLLTSEKEAAEAIRLDLKMEQGQMKEEISNQNIKLAEAHETIKSLEGTLSELHASVALLNEDRASLESELKKLQDETGSKASSLMDAFSNIKSLEGALSQAENHISVLENENKTSNQEISELKLKLDSCLEELAGKSGSLESRSLELVGHLNQLEIIMKDESLFSTMKKDFEKKVKRLKDLDLILNSMESQFSSTHSAQVESEHIIMGESVSDKLFPGDLGNSLDFDVEPAPENAVDGDKISLSFRRTVEGFNRKNKIIVEKFVDFSTSIDEILSVLFRKLEGRRDELTEMVGDMESLKRDMESTKIHLLKQEDAVSMLEDVAKFLLSACVGATKELQFEAKNNLLSFVSVPEIETRECDGIEVAEYRKKLNESKYIKPVEDLLYAASRVKGFVKQFEKVTEAAATKIENLENELNEAQAVSQKALEEGDSKQRLIKKLEKDVKAFEDLCSSLKLKVEDHQTNFNELKEREAEVSSMYSELLLKQQENEGTPLSTSEWRALSDKITGIEIPLEMSERDPAGKHSITQKLFYIIDSFRMLQSQSHLLLQDKEELQSDLAAKVLENKHLRDEVETHSRDAQYLEKTKNDLSEVIFGLERIASLMGISEIARDQKSAGTNFLLPALEKHMMNVLSEFEACKSRTEELGSKLLGSQKVIDELSAKIKFLEGSLQIRSMQPELVQERAILEATSIPSGSEISEIEDADSGGKSLIPPVPSAAHVRTMRKGSTDHLALNIDPESQHLIDAVSDDGKGHKFKSLNTSGLIPKQGKLIADRIDGICVNGGRVLMNRPGARLGLIAYWLFLHIWLLGTVLL